LYLEILSFLKTIVLTNLLNLENSQYLKNNNNKKLINNIKHQTILIKSSHGDNIFIKRREDNFCLLLLLTLDSSFFLKKTKLCDFKRCVLIVILNIISHSFRLFVNSRKQLILQDA